MRKVIIQQCTDSCIKKTKKRIERAETENEKFFASINYCRLSEDVIYFGGEFIFITLPSCYFGHHSEFELYRDILKNAKRSDPFHCDSGCYVNEKEFRDARIRGFELRKYIDEVNYLYGIGKRYAISTRWKFSDELVNQLSLKDEINEAKEYCKNKEYLLNKVEDLAAHNYIHISDKEIHKTLDHFIKQLKQRA